MPGATIDACSAPSELLMRRLLAVPLVLWPLRLLRSALPLDRIAVMTSDPGIAGLFSRHGPYPIPPSPATRLNPGLLIDPLRPFCAAESLRAALDAGAARLDEHQRSPIERLRVEDEPSFELVAAVARGLPPEHPLIAGALRLRAPLAVDVRAVVCDIDGTLTDGGVGFTDRPESLRIFSTRDGLGTHLLLRAGVRIAWLSATSSAQSIHQRARQLGVEAVDAGEGPKGPRFLELCRALDLPPASVAYLGDDVNDLPAMALAGLTACPADAHPSVRARADLVLEAPGGRGAFRELADILLSGSPPPPEASRPSQPA